MSVDVFVLLHNLNNYVSVEYNKINIFFYLQDYRENELVNKIKVHTKFLLKRLFANQDRFDIWCYKSLLCYP